MITIIIPCYNDKIKLQRAVHSALYQNYDGSYEIIIVDDGSSDEIRNDWGGIVRVIRHNSNYGLPVALNTGVEFSCGSRFLILASDDEIRFDCLSIMAKQNADIVSCDFIGGTGTHIHCCPGSIEVLPYKNCHSYCALIKKDMWEVVGGFKEFMNPSYEDWEFFLNCAVHGACWEHIQQPLHMYHRNPNGRDVESQSKERMLLGKLKGCYPSIYGAGSGHVSFIIPCYMQEEFLNDAVRSVIKQTYPHVDVFVVDDGSPGNVAEAIEEFSDCVTIIKQANKHLSGARNAGINEALFRFNSEYIVCLDADDVVHHDFVEELMAYMNSNEYIYCDVELIGDAWHKFSVQEFSCHAMAKRNLHPCTFLMESKMYKDVVAMRGYGYDENMKHGYEDWEFAIAAIEAGWCGRRYPVPLFNYRFHRNGSMRTEAAKLRNLLVAYIKYHHPWIRGSGKMPCGSCNNHRRSKTSPTQLMMHGKNMMMISIPGIGTIDSRMPLLVTYKGGDVAGMTKIGSPILGQGTAIYKFSATAPTFAIYASDAHMFLTDEFDVSVYDS